MTVNQKILTPDLLKLLRNRRWRLNNLYWIKDKRGNRIKFRLNWAQEEILSNLHNLNIILKARQLGITTFFSIFFLDMCFWNGYINAAILADRQSTNLEIFQDKVKFAYDNLDPFIKQMNPARKDNANELRFSNGSVYRVSTALRSGTLQLLHISEFGKICREFPQKATEIMTGALNTVQAGQFITIESTAEGREGYFFNMVMDCQDREAKGMKLGLLDYKMFFLPWWKESEYVVDGTDDIPPSLISYFNELENRKIILKPQQKLWYSKKYDKLGENMKKEYPSVPEEAFESKSDGLYYAKQVSIARESKRIAYVPYDETLKVHTVWDLGFRDSNAIIFFQIGGREVRVINFIESSGVSLKDYIKKLKDQEYIYGSHLAPHDIQNHEYSTGVSRFDTAAKLGIHFTKVPDLSLSDGIDCVRNTFSRLVFNNSESVLSLIRHLENYSQVWDKSLGQWSGRPKHDEHSHACITAETLIFTPVGQIPISNIQIGDEVITPNGSKKVVNKFHYKVKRTLKIHTQNSYLECTVNHKIFTTSSLAMADTLKYNDHIHSIRDLITCQKKYGYKYFKQNIGFRESFLSQKMGWQSILQERVEKIVELNWLEEREVFDIEVEDDHCYYANGLLVSNSDAMRYLCVGLDYTLDETQGVSQEEADSYWKLYGRR